MVALTYGGDRDPLRTYLQHVLTTDQWEQADLNYRAYWVSETECAGVESNY
ncbi:MAG: hypothetical protein JO272_01615 [Pseudonocardiales bacterium]|nr:hypothetical protein [Pseudonocardiales bacterium]